MVERSKRKRKVDRLRRESGSDEDSDEEKQESRPPRRSKRANAAATLASITSEISFLRDVILNHGKSALPLQSASQSFNQPTHHLAYSTTTNPGPVVASFTNLRPPPRSTYAPGAPNFNMICPNKNTSDNVKDRPWSNDASWKGCRRCWANDHNQRACPQVTTGQIRFCHFCKADGHVLPECEALKSKSCKLCKGLGHGDNFCPLQKCGLCGDQGHHRFRCPRK